MGCMRGYFMEGDGKITCNASGIWQPEILSCTGKWTLSCKTFSSSSVCKVLIKRGWESLKIEKGEFAWEFSGFSCPGQTRTRVA